MSTATRILAAALGLAGALAASGSHAWWDDDHDRWYGGPWYGGGYPGYGYGWGHPGYGYGWGYPGYGYSWGHPGYGYGWEQPQQIHVYTAPSEPEEPDQVE